MTGLTKQNVMVVVNRYIGVRGGYLGDFTYRTHSDFYPEYCGLDIDPDQRSGTTRERFIEILSTATPDQQARILRGVLERFPVGAVDAPSTRTAELRATIERMAHDLAGGPAISTPTLSSRTEAVHRALADAEQLIEANGATSSVDRVHTALHAYLHQLCADAGSAVDENASLTALFKMARKDHPALRPDGPRADDIDKILRAFASVLDALNPLRNQASMAHPQAELLPAPEAMLVVHASRTILHYLAARVREATTGDGEPGP